MTKFDTNKTHHGEIRGRRHFTETETDKYGPNLGYLILGRFQDHYKFRGSHGNTSLVIKEEQCIEHDEPSDHKVWEVETLNSRYTFVEIP